MTVFETPRPKYRDRVKLLLGVSVLIAGCSGDPEVASPVLDEGPRYDTAWQIATHNSYWVDRGVASDLAASGVQERLLDQLLVDRARAIEIDIHRDPANPGQFLVFHTKPGNATCASLAECLGVLRVFHRALPEHEVLSVVIELKELFQSNFDDTHRIEDLDQVLDRELGSMLFRPRDLLARCPGETALAACAKNRAWPALATLRGRFIVAVLGNWDQLGGQGTRDWVSYATHGNIADRSAFPMASSWKLDHELLTQAEQQAITASELAGAARESALLQIEDIDDPLGPSFLRAHAVVRADGAASPDDQRVRVERGFQLLQTDTPWTSFDNRGSMEPIRAFAGHDIEPGTRLLLSGEPAFAFVTGASSRFEAVVASGIDARRIGCLRAESGATPAESIEVCRLKKAALAPDGSKLASGSPDAETASVRVETCGASGCSKSEHTAPGASFGELLALDVKDDCATPGVALGVSVDGSVDWQDLEPFCAGSPLVRQGISRPNDAAGEPSAFFGVTRDGVAVRAQYLTSDPTRLSDESTP